MCSVAAAPPSPVPRRTTVLRPRGTPTLLDDELEQVGLVLGLEPATTTEFRILIDETNYLQLDDLVVVGTEVPKAGTVRTYGVVTEVASRHEGGRFESDTLRIAEEFTMDADKSRSATVQTIRVVPEIWVAPDPGEPAWRVSGEARDEALYADEMGRRLPVGVLLGAGASRAGADPRHRVTHGGGDGLLLDAPRVHRAGPAALPLHRDGGLPRPAHLRRGACPVAAAAPYRPRPTQPRRRRGRGKARCIPGRPRRGHRGAPRPRGQRTRARLDRPGGGRDRPGLHAPPARRRVPDRAPHPPRRPACGPAGRDDLRRRHPQAGRLRPALRRRRHPRRGLRRQGSDGPAPAAPGDPARRAPPVRPPAG